MFLGTLASKLRNLSNMFLALRKFKDDPWNFWDRTRSGCEQSASSKSINMSVDMKNKYGGSIRSHDCYLKWCIKNSSTQYSFYVMESGVSRNCFRNIHRPSTLEKEVNRKGNTVGKIARRRKIRKFTHAQI